MLFLIAHNTSTANRIKNGHFTYFRIFYACSDRSRLNWLLPFDSASNFTPGIALGVFFNWPQQRTINWKEAAFQSNTMYLCVRRKPKNQFLGTAVKAGSLNWYDALQRWEYEKGYEVPRSIFSFAMRIIQDRAWSW